LSDGASVVDLLPADDDRIRLIHLAEPRTVGEKRNFGCEQVDSDVVCHWDDDDYSAPGRLADQLQRLRESGKAVTGYSAMRFTDGERWWQYRGEAGYVLGTSLCYRRNWWQAHPFQAKQVGEDNDFVYEAQSCRELAAADGNEFMYATNHAGNTSPRMIGDNWKLLS
jgi:glycosyltransferase involved in cell wall biosynthesis